ncbi:DUF6085 family protein [Streptomyces sp. NPDC088747]|uniref:DUF6085 family protein n=1 Tax=Streptomyces sp. NPDC088747 TaxID=3365886 RepID=UPI0038296365
MTLGELIETLAGKDPGHVLPLGFNNPHSYRGSYTDLAFEPARNISVDAVLASARSALGKAFQGYKGGTYVMGEDTDVWLSPYGEASGESIGPTLLRLMLASTSTRDVQGHCPGCGGTSLYVGSRGLLHCPLGGCPRSDAAHVILADGETEHVVKLNADGWIVRHPLRERIGDALMTCTLNTYLWEVDQPEELGTFRARREDNGGGEVWSWERVT